MVSIYNKIIRKVLKITFLFWENLGFHIIPNHYYEPEFFSEIDLKLKGELLLAPVYTATVC